MFRVGIVAQLDAARARVRVTFRARDQVRSSWLLVVTRGTQNNKDYWMPDLGEQVVCLMDAHDEDGAVLGALYSSQDTPPVSSADKWHATMKDGAIFEYDRSSHAMAVALPDGATLSVTANGAVFAIDAAGNITIDGNSIILAGGGPKVARVGDQVEVMDPDDGTIYGTITSGSPKVTCG